MSQITKHMNSLNGISDFKIVSHINQTSTIEFIYNGNEYIEKLKRCNIRSSMISFVLKGDGKFVEVERGESNYSLNRQENNEYLNVRKKDILLYTDDLKIKLYEYVKHNPSNKYAAFLYHAITTEQISIKAKSDNTLYQDKSDSFNELIRVAKELNYNIHIVSDPKLTWKYKLCIIVLDDGTELAYHFKDVRFDLTHDYVWDGSAFRFTKYLVKKIRKLLNEPKPGKVLNKKSREKYLKIIRENLILEFSIILDSPRYSKKVEMLIGKVDNYLMKLNC